jgi:hypothetical protein
MFVVKHNRGQQMVDNTSESDAIKRQTDGSSAVDQIAHKVLTENQNSNIRLPEEPGKAMVLGNELICSNPYPTDTWTPASKKLEGGVQHQDLAAPPIQGGADMNQPPAEQVQQAPRTDRVQEVTQPQIPYTQDGSVDINQMLRNYGGDLAAGSNTISYQNMPLYDSAGRQVDTIKGSFTQNLAIPYPLPEDARISYRVENIMSDGSVQPTGDVVKGRIYTDEDGYPHFDGTVQHTYLKDQSIPQRYWGTNITVPMNFPLIDRIPGRQPQQQEQPQQQPYMRDSGF